MENLINSVSLSLFLYQSIIILHIILLFYCFYLVNKDDENELLTKIFFIIVSFFIPLLGPIFIIINYYNKKPNKLFSLILISVIITSCSSDENKTNYVKDQNIVSFKNQKEADDFFNANKEFFSDTLNDNKKEEFTISPRSSEFTEVINDKKRRYPASVEIYDNRVILVAKKSYRGTFQSLNIELNMVWANRDKTSVKGDRSVRPNVKLYNTGLNISQLEVFNSSITGGPRGGSYNASGNFLYRIINSGSTVMTKRFYTTGTWSFYADNGKYRAYLN